MNTLSIRRSVLAVLLAAPLSLSAQTSPADQAAPPTSPIHPDLRPGKIAHVLTPAQLQAIMNPATNVATETTQDEPLPDVVVSGNAQTGNETKFPIAARPCGVMSVVWFIEHPADGWRVFAPIAADSELEACLKPPLTAVLPAYVATERSAL